MVRRHLQRRYGFIYNCFYKPVLRRPLESTQCTSYAFGKCCREMNVMPSTGAVGNAYGSSMAESSFATLERELLDRTRFRTQAEAKLAVFE